MTLGIVRIIEELPSTTSYFVSTRCYRRHTHSDTGTWQYDSRRIDIFHSRNTTLEVNMDVQHMTLSIRCDMSTCFIAHLIVILIDDCDYLLRREVVNVSIACHIQRTGLHRRFSMDSEVLLIVRQRSIALLITIISSFDNGTKCYPLTIFSCNYATTACTGNTCHRSWLYTFSFLANLIFFAAVIIRLRLAIDSCHIISRKGERSDVFSVIIIRIFFQIFIFFRTDSTAYSKSFLTMYEGLFDNIVRAASCCHSYRSIVTLLIRQLFIYLAIILITICQRDTIVRSSIVNTIVCSSIINRRRQ